MAKQWEEGGLRSIWNSLFDASEFSACKETDDDLQGVSMLLKKMFYAFEKLKQRCQEAESAQQRPCHRCASLEKVIKAYKAKLQQTESRMKSIAQILNMGGGLSQDKNASPSKQQSMARALTQMLFGGESEISEDEGEPEERGTKRKRCGPITPIKVNVITHKRSPVKETLRRGNVIGPEKRQGKSLSLSAETKKVSERPQAKMALPETLCSQTPAPLDVVFISDNEETYMDPLVPKVTPTKRNVPPAHSQGKSSPIIRSKIGKKLVLESLSLSAETTKVSERPQAKMALPETLCSQTPAPLDVVFISDNEETYMNPLVPKVTPTKRNVPPAHSQGKSSPIIRSKIGKKSSRLKLDGRHAKRSLEGDCTRDDGNNCTFTPSPPLCSSGAGSKKSPFTPRLRVTKDKTNNPVSPCESDLTPGDIEAKVIPAPKETTPGDISRMPVPSIDIVHASKYTTPSDFVQTLVPTPDLLGVADETFVSPSLLHGMNTLSKSRQQHCLQAEVASDPKSAPKASTPDFGRIVSTGNADIDDILDMMCDTNAKADIVKPSSSKRSDEDGPDSLSVARRQADFWRLKPLPSGKEPFNVNGQRLKQTKIAFGVHPERTDVCTLKEFNGGVRQSQCTPPLSDTLALREFNGGIRPGQTSTMLPVEYSDDAAFEQAILDSLRDTNTQFVPDRDDDRDEDFVLPSPDTSKRFVSSQRAKPNRGAEASVVDLKENKAMTPDAEDLLAEMAAPSLPRTTADHLVRGFDRVPKRHEDVPAHKYQRDAVRKHDERKKMEGWDCADCKKYYALRVNDSGERKQLMDRCSKHRDIYQRNDSPLDYWNPEFPSTPELKARNLDITQKALKFHTRKRH